MFCKQQLFASGILAAFATATVTAGQSFDLSWHTIDGGGGYSAGGGFELEGTIGQPDGGQAMTGGDFELTGGFWPGAGAGDAEPCVGDLNGDNVVDLTDLAILLSDFDCTSGCIGDVDGDLDTDLTDLAILLANFDLTCP